ncbi:hypothetical protein N7455_006398 [Penicillium solitum]|uniref:uncharacterized protein n=1 Tax=Penicillium solitum TaxID=60172 RepID=UPI001821AB68|nr:hypothetical protein HAV15_011871 [Penicillium sp. str. \
MRPFFHTSGSQFLLIAPILSPETLSAESLSPELKLLLQVKSEILDLTVPFNEGIKTKEQKEEEENLSVGLRQTHADASKSCETTQISRLRGLRAPATIPTNLAMAPDQ